MPEISDQELQQLYAELQRLQGRAQIADFIEPIYNDPLLNKEAKALIKKKYPNVQITDYDLEQKFEKRFDEMTKARDDAEKQKREHEEQEQWNTQRKSVQDEYGYTDDGMKDLESYMVKNKIGDYKVAAEHHALKNPKLTEAHHHNGRWEHQKQDGFADISKDPEGWAHDQIYGALLRDQERAKGR